MVNAKSLRNLKPAWQIGHSGNPRGRAVGSKNMTTLTKRLSKYLQTPCDGSVTREEQFVRCLLSKAINGDMKYINIILDVSESDTALDKRIYQLIKQKLNTNINEY